MPTPLVRDRALAPLCESLRSGALRPSDLVEELCDRLDVVEARLRSLVPELGRRERLHSECAELEARFASKDSRPPLFGVPVAVKDIIAVDGFATRAGSSLPPDAFADALGSSEAPVVRRLRDAGALVLGKSVTTQFAYLDPAATTNPHNPKHTPGGSSSGSAAGVAAGVAPLALGTQTAGSINRPAAFCGVVGLKPSFGRIPTEGVLPCAPSYDTVGCFAQDAPGLGIACCALLEDWRADVPSNERPILGVPDGPYLDQVQPASRRAFEAALSHLTRAGFEILRMPCLEEIEAIGLRHRNTMSVEFAQVHEERFEHFGALFGPHAAMLLDRGRALGPGAENAGQLGRRELREELAALRTQKGFDFWIAPAAPGPAPSGLLTTGDARMNVPWTQAGVPCLTIPAGRARSGLPLGVQLAGTFGEDEELLAGSLSVERALREPGRRLEAADDVGQ